MAPDAPAPDGEPRPVLEQHTHVGPLFDGAVARIRGQMTPAGVDADYDLAYERFDLTHFLLQARHMLGKPKVDPLRVFLGNGAGAAASPEVNFDMAAYLARHPERGETGRSPYVEWLEQGCAAGEVADPAPGLEKMAPVLGMQPGELARVLGEARLDVQQRLRTGGLGEMLARAAEIEPLIGEVWPATTRPTMLPLTSRDVVDEVALVHSCQKAAGFRPARLVIVASEPRWGGGRRAEGHIAHALAGHLDPREVVVVYTDNGGSAPPGRFPDGVREVDFATAAEGVARPAAVRALAELVRSLQGDSVVNVNSRLLYEVLDTYGEAFTRSERVFPLLLCNEQLALGNWVGLPLRFFHRAFDLVEGVLTDSEYLVGWLRERHKLDTEGGDRLHVLRAPVDPSVPLAPEPPVARARRPQVFWAGRWDRQKRVDIALEVARRMPEVDVRMWGEAVLTRGQMTGVPDNVRLEGPYAHFSALPLAEADLWLYTAAWDGVPSQLLEVSMTGVPIVGSLVGGTGEVLGQDDAWPVAELEDPDAYVAAIRAVLADPAAARRRAMALRERMLAERTEAAYGERAAELLLRGRRAGDRG